MTNPQPDPTTALREIAAAAMTAQSDPHASARVYRAALRDVCQMALNAIEPSAEALRVLREERDHRISKAVEQAAAIDAKVRQRYIGQIQEQTERADAAESSLTALRSALTALREKAVNIVGMCQDAVDDRWPPHIAVDEAQKVAAAIVTELDAALLVPAGGRKNDDQTRVDGRGTEGPTGSTAPAA